MELRTTSMDMWQDTSGRMKVILFDKNLMRRLNKILLCYAEDTVFQDGDEAIFKFSIEMLDQVKVALKIKS